ETNALVACFLELPKAKQAGVRNVVMGISPKDMNRTPSLAGEYYCLRALYEMGFIDDAWSHLCAEWSPQALSGASTNWEGKGPDSRSCCHAWASGANAFFIQEVLGIKPLTAGYDTLIISPKPGTLKSAKGQCWTPHGIVKVDWKFRSSTEWQLEITAPRAIKVTVDIVRQTALNNVKQIVKRIKI
ncbi:MAG: hypothetical protein HRT89_19305, partial [Lentisphaeria bacterium]|nr:hypothetical protein [Lentisphaeria bacterium]NQZ70206.1 hypothetical protein [Lentisphaeria bacterium]